MRIKHIISEKKRTAFGRGIARGFTATQKGGLIGPDSAEQAIKNFFTKTGDDPKKDKPKSDVKKTKNTVVTKKPADATKPTEKGKPAPEPKTTEPKTTQPKAAEPKAKDDFPSGVIRGGTYVKVKPGDAVVYVNAKGQTKDGEVTKLLDTRDKQGDLQIQLRKKSAVFAIDRDNITKVNGQDWKYSPEQGSDAGKTKENIMSKAMKEGLADLAGRAEADHEVQMARADLYKIAKYAIKLHDMLKGVSEETGLEGWQQAKITKAADYIGSVYHNLDYDMKFGEGMNEGVEMCPKECCGKPVTECSCGPDCPHCDCYEKNKAMKEGKYKNDAQRKAVHAAKAQKKDKYKESLSAKLERTLTKGEDKKKEKYVKGMKKAKDDFKDRYGDDAEAVMYATATKMAKKKKLKASKAVPITTPADIQPDNIQPDSISPNTGGHPTGS